LGRFEEVKILVLDCQGVLTGDDPEFFRILAGIATGLFWLRFGEHQLAVETLASVLPLTEQETNSAWFQPVASPLGLALVRTGRPKEALPLLQKSTHRLSAHSGANHGMQFAHLSECLLSLGSIKKAEAKAREAIMNARRTSEAGTLAYSLNVLGMVLEADERNDEATQVLQECRSLAKKCRMEPLLKTLNSSRP
jgi:hypothetical protein